MISPTFDLAQHPTGDTIRLLSSLLERMTSANDHLNKSILTRKGTGDNRSFITHFHASSIPTIHIYSYLCRIMKYCPCANECFLALLVYFDRMSKYTLALTKRPFTIDSYNIHRLIISGVMVSCKFFSDIFYTNTRYAKVGGLPVSELNRLELEFLKLNDYNVSVSIDELQRYGDQLLKVGMMERMMYDTSYTTRYGRSTSLGSTGLGHTLDGFEAYRSRKSMDHHQQQWMDKTSQLHLDDSHLLDNKKRHSICSASKPPYYQYYYQGNQNNSDLCTHASPSSPQPSMLLINGGTSLPSYYPGFVDHSSSSFTTTCSSPCQRLENLDLNDITEEQDDDWLTPRQTRSSTNLYQQTWTPIIYSTSQQPFHLVQYHHPGGGGGGVRGRRLSLTPALPQRSASVEYRLENGPYYPMISTCYYQPYSLGIPTPPPSSSPICHHHKSDPSYPYLPSSHQLYL